MFLRFSPAFAAFWTILLTLGLAYSRRDTRLPLKPLAQGFADGAIVGAQIAVAIACVGLVSQTIITTGLGPSSRPSRRKTRLIEVAVSAPVAPSPGAGAGAGSGAPFGLFVDGLSLTAALKEERKAEPDREEKKLARFMGHAGGSDGAHSWLRRRGSSRSRR